MPTPQSVRLQSIAQSVADTLPPLETVTLCTVCPDSTSSRPPLDTFAAPPLVTTAPLTVPPAPVRRPPLDTVVSLAVAPAETI